MDHSLAWVTSPYFNWRPSLNVSLTTSEDLFVRKQTSVEIWQVIPLILAAALLTIGLSMFLSGTEKLIDVVQPVIVVFGGALVGLLLTFSTSHLGQALQTALVRGIRGGSAPVTMIKAMLKVCEVSRRDGLLGVADIRSNSDQVEEVCCLIGDASDEQSIRFALERRMASERRYHQMSVDVFVFTGIYAVLIGMLGSLLLYVSPAQGSLGSAVVLPFVCGISLAILMCILVGRLRTAHLREQLMVEIAYKTASIILEDNNVQHLRSRLGLLVTSGL
jgi:chemotaxis protein MotA